QYHWVMVGTLVRYLGTKMFNSLFVNIQLISPYSGDHNFLMMCPGGVFIVRKQLLIDLFTRTKSYYFNTDVFRIIITFQADHTYRKIHDLDWLSHVEYIDFPALTHHRSL